MSESAIKYKLERERVDLLAGISWSGLRSAQKRGQGGGGGVRGTRRRPGPVARSAARAAATAPGLRQPAGRQPRQPTPTRSLKPRAAIQSRTLRFLSMLKLWYLYKPPDMRPPSPPPTLTQPPILPHESIAQTLWETFTYLIHVQKCLICQFKRWTGKDLRKGKSR